MVMQGHSQKKYLAAIIFLAVIVVALSGWTALQSIDLHETQNTLTLTQNELVTIQAGLTQTQTDLATARTELATTQAGLTQTQTDLATARTELTNVPLDPTYQQMESFLAADKTDRNTYNAATYDCVNFSADVIADAAKSKIRCAYVNIDERDSGHAIVAFNTTDRGLIYIEPQSDEEVNLQVGRHYYQCIIPEPGSYYIPPGYDDTVVRFIVIW